MTYAAALLLIGVVFLAAAAATVGLIALQPDHGRHRYHEVGIAIFLQLGVVFAVLLAFVFDQVWEQFNVAQDAVDKECVDIEGAANRSTYLPVDVAARLRVALRTYVQSEIDSEWPAMSHRRPSRETTLAYSRLFAEAAAIVPTSPLIEGSRNEILHLLDRVHDERQLRLFQLKSNVPAFLWGLLGTFSFVLTLFVMLGAVGHRLVHAVLVGIFAALVVAIMLTIHLLDYPFEGSIRVTTEPLRTALAVIDDATLGLTTR